MQSITTDVCHTKQLVSPTARSLHLEQGGRQHAAHEDSVFAFPLAIAVRTFVTNVQRELKGMVAIAGESDDDDSDGAETDDEETPNPCARTWADVFGNAPDAGHTYHHHHHRPGAGKVGEGAEHSAQGGRWKKMETPMGPGDESESLDSFQSLPNEVAAA